jgi:glycogen phosphorylase
MKRKYTIAYFSMEIGIHPEIPTYAGGLGVLAGDTLRSCADLKLYVVGVSLLYRKGYFNQSIDGHGNQSEADVHWNPEAHMLLLPKTVKVQLEGRDVKVRAWLYHVHSAGHSNHILFLDTDIEGNSDWDRKITDSLYGNDDKYRLAQEIVLGIGGVRMLQTQGYENVDKYHMNEGHSSLLALELFTKHKSIQAVRQRCVFTTHTPVPSGHDQFPRALVEQMLQVPPQLQSEIYYKGKLNMTYLGLRFSEYINGVAKKHGEVSRGLFPGYIIESITNGVHSAFWTSEPFKRVFNKYFRGWELDPFCLRYAFGIPLDEIWEAHQKAKQKLINHINDTHKTNMDTETFTIGFARRAATYKRGDMLFSDLARLKKLSRKYKGIQIIYAGKAHPRDEAGKEVIRKIIRDMQQLSTDVKCFYMPNYDIEMALLLVSGVDLWLNTPMRPKEASGTSGMKAAHNGVPQLSTLDGWWLEGHIEGITGWSIGSHPGGAESGHDEDVEDMYAKLEYLILPMFYQDRIKWIEVMRHAIAVNGSFFNTHRMVQQYVMNAYFQ